MERIEALVLRGARKADCRFLYELRNEEMVRRNSFYTHTIPYEQHKRWFFEKMQRADVEIYILEKEGMPIGQVRVEVTGEEAEISYALVKDARGHGHARWMLARLEHLLAGRNACLELVADVKQGNAASSHIFQSLCYEECEQKYGYQYRKRIG